MGNQPANAGPGVRADHERAARLWMPSALERRLEMDLALGELGFEPFWRYSASHLLAQIGRVVRLSRERVPTIADVCWLAGNEDDVLEEWLLDAQGLVQSGRSDPGQMEVAASWKHGVWDQVDHRTKRAIRRTLFLAALKVVDGSWSHTRELGGR